MYHRFSKKPRLTTTQSLPNRRKNEVCKRFQRGNCFHGDRCSYAHVNLNPKNHQQQLITNNNDNSKLCFRFMNGEKCEYGDRCHFNHKRPMKTKLCRKWMSTGTCRYGFTCCFAHGHLELQRGGDVGYSKDGSCGKNVDRKRRFMWDDVEKISRVYADWIDDADASLVVHVETGNVNVAV